MLRNQELSNGQLDTHLLVDPSINDTMFSRKFKTRFREERLTVFVVTAFVILSIIILGLDQQQPVPKQILCDDGTISQDPEQDKSIIDSYPVLVQTNASHMAKLGLDNKTLTRIKDKDVDVPVIVTATSSNHLKNTMVWLESVKHLQLIKKYRVIVYDLGLRKDEKMKLCRDGECFLQEFPFAMFPDFVKKKLYLISWKPLIIQLSLRKYGYIIWMDSTVFLKSNQLDAGLKIAEREGIAVSYKVGIDKDVPLSYSTSELTFKSFGEKPCKYESLSHFSSGFIIIRLTKFTQTYVMRPWVACALSEQCMGGGRTRKKLCLKADAVGFCHRFDLSSLSIILHRLYSTENRTRVNINGLVDWVNCYYHKEYILLPDDIVVPDGYKYSISDCPHELLGQMAPQISQPNMNRKAM